MAPAVKVVVFDLDGTLTDSEAGIVSSYRHALDSWGIEVDDRAIRPWIGPPLRDGFLALGVPPSDVDRAIGRYREFFSTRGIFENRLYPGIAPMLESMAGAGVILAVASSKLTEYVLRILDHFSISSLFEAVAGATRDGTRLHKEEILEHALGELGRPDPWTVVMVGDREQDIRAAIGCGVRSVGATWGYGSTSELLDAGVEALAATPSELISLLLGDSSAASSGLRAPGGVAADFQRPSR